MVYLFLADGFEEVEAITPIDVLRRAGVEIKTVSINEKTLTIKGAHNIEVLADITLDECDVSDTEMIILPGGALGTENLKNCERVRDIILSCNERGIYIAAICAAPTILAEMSLITGLRATCYPSLVSKMIENGVKYKNDKVVCDKHFITSMGAGTAGEFAFTLVDKLKTKKESDNLRLSMVY
ncbi:MAG: DJ-1/PfpI family protein [Ruminococcaceae bacterium]|nr:DJ-1/PfpI family protein [Oscillospiraceae bacterium]